MSEYRLNDPQKGIIGPVRLSTVRDLMAAGVIGPQVVVSKDGGPFAPLAEFAEIPALPQGQGGQPQQAPSYAGDIGKHTFFKLFFRLHYSRAHGLLVVEDGSRRKDITLAAGAPVLTFSSEPYERLGEVLALAGRVPRRRLLEAIEALGPDERNSGDALVQAGLLTAAELQAALRAQACQRLVDLCLWESGHYAFFEGRAEATAEPRRAELSIAAPDLVMQAGREMPERTLLRRLREHYLDLLVPSPRLAQQVALLRFNDTEKAIIKSLDGQLGGPRVVADIACHYGDEPSLRRAALMVIYLLWEVDAVSFTAPP